MPIILLCGIPAAGKTTLSQKIAEKFNATCFSFDEFVETQLDPSTASTSNTINANSSELTDVDEEEDLLKPMKIYRKLWEQSIEAYFNQLIKNGDSNPMIILDDNFYLQSQRRSFAKIGKRYGLKICSMKVMVDVEEAQKRNLERNCNNGNSKKVMPKKLLIDSEIIKKMAQKFEDSGIEYFYESISSAAIINLIAFIQNFQQTYPDNFSMPKPDIPELLPIIDESVLQAIDTLSRQITNRIISSGYQRYGKEINDVRREFVERFKNKRSNLKADDIMSEAIEDLTESILLNKIYERGIKK
uniref:L-seryl-tRNA(Sec) kinase n=1 Tax=Panagrolaimus sp. ES5 TaxID=591445 RepID=A0AC34GXQ1_9BILA